jgi:Spy/CpxP family protein refolding chaperone
MTSKVKIWLRGAALAGAAVMSVAAWAMGPPGGMEPDPAQMMAHMSKHLDLSAEQQSKVEGLLATAKQASAADQKRMQELRVEMKGMRDNFDAEKARKLADEIGQVTGRLVYQASATWSSVYQLLNAEQKAKLDGMMAKRDERRGKWREGDERPSR